MGIGPLIAISQHQRSKPSPLESIIWLVVSKPVDERSRLASCSFLNEGATGFVLLAIYRLVGTSSNQSIIWLVVDRLSAIRNLDD